MLKTERLCTDCIFTKKKLLQGTARVLVCGCMSMFSLNPLWQEASVHPDGPEFWEQTEALLYFAAPKGSWEQNVGDGPEQVVHTCRREGRAEHHDDS